MRILFAGTPASAVPVFNALLSSSHQVVGVLTRPPARKGRGRQLVESPVALAAQAAGIPVYTPSTLKDPAQHPDWQQLNADLAVVVAYGMILPASVLKKLRLGWWNLHYSLLPDWRGAAPVQAVLENQLSQTGVSMFQIDEGLDTGPILSQMPLAIQAEHTADSLLADLSELGAKMVLSGVDRLACLDNQADLLDYLQVQPEVSPTPYARMFTKEQARIDWQQPAQKISALIRAYTSNPGAWTVLPDGQKLTIFPVQEVLATDRAVASIPAEVWDLAAGQVLVNKKYVWVGCADHPVELSKVQVQGKKPMLAADWGRGQRFGQCFQLGGQ